MYNQVDKFLRPQNGGIFGFGYHCFKRKLVDVEFLYVQSASIPDTYAYIAGLADQVCNVLR